MWRWSSPPFLALRSHPNPLLCHTIPGFSASSTMSSRLFTDGIFLEGIIAMDEYFHGDTVMCSGFCILNSLISLLLPAFFPPDTHTGHLQRSRVLAIYHFSDSPHLDLLLQGFKGSLVFLLSCCLGFWKAPAAADPPLQEIHC